MKILIIQTAFIGDAILATSVLEKLHLFYPQGKIDFLVRKGNEGLFAEHPFLRRVLVWDKQGAKYANWWRLLRGVRAERYDVVVSLQRFASMGLFTALSKAGKTIGFENAPFSSLFSERHTHQIGNGTHEIERNHLLITSLTDSKPAKPRLYPTLSDEESVKSLKTSPYICIAPASVWHTKQFPQHKWIDLISHLPKEFKVYLLGSKGDSELCGSILAAVQKNSSIRIESLCSKLGLLASTALMRDAAMNYVNDSAPMHLASAVNAPTCAVFCSTVPAFGFTPLSEKSSVVQIAEALACRPCGLHGHKACPKGHFRCAEGISTGQLLAVIGQ
ncbi:MAG: glycosyltransferase family 9 protein [Cytophagales bacterium]|nr:MAG: glycosyltransferase family 9 protein [Cytophagales bacterium]